MSTGSEKKIFLRQLVISTSLFLLLLGSLVAAYTMKFEQQFAEDNHQRLHEISDFTSAHMVRSLENMQALLRVAAHAIAPLDDNERLRVLEQMLGEFAFPFMGFAGSDGQLHATMPSESQNISNEPYFLAAKAGKMGISGQMRKLFPNRAASGVILAVPLHSEKETEVLVAMLETQHLKNSMRFDGYGSEGNSYIIDSTGSVIMSTRRMEFGNLFRAWERQKFQVERSLAEMEEDVHEGRGGLVRFVDSAGRARYAHYQPMSVSDWTLLLVVNDEVISARTISLTREMAAMGGGILALFLGLLVWAVLTHRQARESRLAADTKSAFLANMSHEIRTPMNAIVGLSEIMLHGDATPAQRENLIRILNSSKGLLAIINDILDVSKIESGSFAFLDEPYELAALLHDITIVAAIRIGEKPVEFLVDLDQNLPARLVGDEGRVKQVLLNIVNNSIKFTERGFIRLQVNGQRDEKGWKLRFAVRDTGIGISEEDLPRLFVRFNQVDTKRARKAEGTGLGLAISAKLCALMHGDIDVMSQLGKGSTFTATLRQRPDKSDTPLICPLPAPSATAPLSLLLCEISALRRVGQCAFMDTLGLPYQMCPTEAEFLHRAAQNTHTHLLAPRAVLQQLPAEKTAARIALLPLSEHINTTVANALFLPLFALQLPCILSGNVSTQTSMHAVWKAIATDPLPHVHVLVVDDNELNLLVAEGMLAPFSMHVDTAISGDEAILAVQAHAYDLVFMDHMMPGMDGVETTRHIRGLGSQYTKLPIVALTANATTEARKLFTDNGFNDFLAKPIEPDKLHTILRTWLRELNQQRAAEISNQP